MAVVLEFEKPIIDIQNKIDELKKMSEASGLDMEKQIETFEKQAEDYKKELYSKLKPSQKLQIARHAERPKFLDYVDLICEDFIELHGDREGMDDRAIIGGLAKINGKPVMIIGIQKGNNTKENLEYNFGMPQPQGYRKALRLMQHANKFNLPVVKNLLDNFGFYNGRPITKSMLAWWAFHDDKQGLLSLETTFEIEHIYAKNRNEKEHSLSDPKNVELLGNKALLEKRVNIRASDYRFQDKVVYYRGYTNKRGQEKEGTKVQELLYLSSNAVDFTDSDILNRTEAITTTFLSFLQENNLTL